MCMTGIDSGIAELHQNQELHGHHGQTPWQMLESYELANTHVIIHISTIVHVFTFVAICFTSAAN